MTYQNKENDVSIVAAKNIVYLGKKMGGNNIKDIEMMLDLSPGYLSRCISGNHRLSLDVASTASSYFCVPINELTNKHFEKCGYVPE